MHGQARRSRMQAELLCASDFEKSLRLGKEHFAIAAYINSRNQLLKYTHMWKSEKIPI